MKLTVDKKVLELVKATFSYCLGEEECQMISCSENEVVLKLEDNSEITLCAAA